ncbi:unnamed protein product [Arctogadus glacialis]
MLGPVTSDEGPRARAAALPGCIQAAGQKHNGPTPRCAEGPGLGGRAHSSGSARLRIRTAPDPHGSGSTRLRIHTAPDPEDTRAHLPTWMDNSHPCTAALDDLQETTKDD